MGIEGFNLAPEEKFEKERKPLQLQQEIQSSFLAHNFSPAEETRMVQWLGENGEAFSNIFKELSNEHEDFGYLWDTAPEAVLEIFNERLRNTMKDVKDWDNTPLKDDVEKAA